MSNAVPLSIVIPVLDEAPGLPDLLAHLAPLAGSEIEILFVDGGSSDTTAATARAAGFRVLESESGRARQMNAGARASSGDVLLFLHADTRLPADAATAIRQATCHRPWGRFDVRLDHATLALRVVATLMNWRSRLNGIATGDQGLFMTRHAFDTVSGFPEQPLMEDIDMSAALKKLGRPACLTSRVTASSRRWRERGVWRTIVLMWQLRWKHWRGVPLTDIAQAYR